MLYYIHNGTSSQTKSDILYQAIFAAIIKRSDSESIFVQNVISVSQKAIITPPPTLVLTEHGEPMVGGWVHTGLRWTNGTETHTHT